MSQSRFEFFVNPSSSDECALLRTVVEEIGFRGIDSVRILWFAIEVMVTCMYRLAEIRLIMESGDDA